MMPVQLDVRLFDEVDRLVGSAEYVVPQAAVEELRRLREGGGTEGTAAAVGLDLVRERCGVVDTSAAVADDAIVELAAAGRVAYVATNDLGLRDRVLSEDVSVLALRGRNKLAVTRP